MENNNSGNNEIKEVDLKEQQSEPENEQETKEENKDSKFKTFFKVFVAVDIIVIIIILLLLCLRKCKSNDNSNSSIPDSSEKYDSAKLDDVFKRLVANQMGIDGYEVEPLISVLAVTYSDHGNSFSLSIDVRSEKGIYYYHLINHVYTGYSDFVSYLLDYDFGLSNVLSGEYTLRMFDIIDDVVITSKMCNYAISENEAKTTRYLSGFSFEGDEFYVYQQKELTEFSPLKESADKVITSDDLLYSYYKFSSESTLEK